MVTKTKRNTKAKSVKKVKRIDKKNSSEFLVDVVIKGMQEKKAFEITKIDLKNINNSVCSYFVVCHGASNTQVNAIADSVEYEVAKKISIKPWHKEGFENSEWILLDYVDVVVHIFQEEHRGFYKLEKLWADAEITEIK